MSFSRSSMRSFSEDMRILLQGLGGEAQAGDAARRMVLQESSLVGLEQVPFDTFTEQKEQLPVGMFDQLGTRRLMLLEVEHDVGKDCHRDISRCDPFVNRPLEDTEVPQGRHESPRYSENRVFAPCRSRFAFIDPSGDGLWD